MSKVKWNLVLPPIALFLLAAIWAPISPVASAADDDYHLASIWCASGKPDLCYKTPASNQYFVPKAFTELPSCYVTWPRATEGASCANSFSSELTLTSRVNTGASSDIFYSVNSIFASQDLYESVLSMRIFNSFLASLFLLLAIYVSSFKIRRALILSWGIAIAPVGIFFISSTNPSSWAIIGIGTFWAFLISSFLNFKEDNKKFIFSILGLLASALISIGARYDSAVYLTLSFIAIVIYQYKNKWIKNHLKVFFLFLALLIPFTFYLFIQFSNRWGRILEFPSAQEAPNDQPNAVINTLIELPAFIVGIFGGQAPDWVQRYGDLGRDFTFGIGWLEFNFPSITGVLIGGAAISAFFLGFNDSSKRKTLAALILFLPVIGLIVYSRAAFGFRDATYFQPRYFIPLFLVLLSIALLNDDIKRPIFSIFQRNLLLLMVLVGSLFAWQATVTRYAVNPQAAFTNFAQELEWWPLPESITRLDLFFVSLFIHIFWLLSTIYWWGKSREKSTDSYTI